MKRPLLLIAALAGLVAAREAAAVWTETRITPQSVGQTTRRFTVRSEMRDNLRQYEVIVEHQEGRKISPFADATIRLISDDKTVALVPVEPKWEGGKVRFWFRVSPEAVKSSRFDYREQAYSEKLTPGGRPAPYRERRGREEMLLGGQAWYFFLRDFAT